MTTLLPFQLEIPKRGTLCSLCQEPHPPGSEIYSLLIESDRSGVYGRQDFCLSCREKHKSDFESNHRCSAWKSLIPTKREASDLPRQRDERAMCLLKEALLQSEDKANMEAFVLALYLARKRLIFFRRDIHLENGQIVSVFEVAQSGEMLSVPKINLSSLQVESTQSDLAAKFKA